MLKQNESLSATIKDTTYNYYRRSIRLKNYDYSQPGAYFITICTRNRECLFGKIVNDEMVLNDAGDIIRRYWGAIPVHYPNVQLDEFIVMPNHIHGILILNENTVGVQNFEPLQIHQKIKPKQNRFQHIIPDSIGSIVRGFKIGVTKWFRQNTGGIHIVVVWQRNYYEHIIRDEIELNKIREYIVNNPVNWNRDENYI